MMVDIGSQVIKSKDELRDILRIEGTKKHYTYILRKPDGMVYHGGTGTPFYVGIGQGMRLFQHVEEAKEPGKSGRKVSCIRDIWASGGEVIHTIDGFFDEEPWGREAALLRSIGQLKHGTGPLTNEQDYALSHQVQGAEVRKYRDVQGGDPNHLPAKFKLADVRLKAGPRRPKKMTSVFGKIYSTLETNPGVTGRDLVELLKGLDFTGNKSVYTQTGKVCATWLCDYVEGGYFRADRQHLQRFDADEC